ncbi:polynucleotide kinase [Aeromonas phage AP1]|nr:polynucleotide kinase [Aeromonas phage AP1]
MNAYITIGASSSGKSTWAEMMVKKSQGKMVNINRDDTRRSLFQIKSWKGYNFGKDREALVTDVNWRKVLAAHETGKEIVISDTNLNEKFRKVMIKELKDLGYNVTLVWFPVPMEELKHRNSTRGGWSVNDSVLDRMVAQFDDQWSHFDYYGGGIVVDFEPKVRYTPDESLPKAVIFDVDGTVAEKNDRDPFDWSRVKEDTPRHTVIQYAQLLKYRGYVIIVASGRDGVCMQDTYDWCVKYGMPIDVHIQRKPGDQRSDKVIKEELFWEHIAPYYNVTHCVDDRDQVVKMWRDLGIECFQVAPGSF